MAPVSDPFFPCFMLLIVASLSLGPSTIPDTYQPLDTFSGLNQQMSNGVSKSISEGRVPWSFPEAVR